MFSWISQGLDNIANFIKQVLDAILGIFDYINPLSENFIFKDVLKFLADILSYINPFSDKFILKDIINFFLELLSYINPFSENFWGYKIIDLISDLLKFLFVPKEDHFTYFKNAIDEKFGFISQIKDLVNKLFSFKRTRDIEQPPSFEITYEGVTYKIVDFSILERFRSFFHAIVCSVLWIGFLLRLYKRIPGIIGAYHSSDSNSGGV